MGYTNFFHYRQSVRAFWCEFSAFCALFSSNFKTPVQFFGPVLQTIAIMKRLEPEYCRYIYVLRTRQAEPTVSAVVPAKLRIEEPFQGTLSNVLSTAVINLPFEIKLYLRCLAKKS